MENRQQLSLGGDSSGVVIDSRHRWKNQVDIQEILTAIDTPATSYTDEDKEEAFELLKSGKSIAQVAVLLNIPNLQIRRWCLQARASGPKVDGRRLYDDTFKAEALRQLNRGISVRQLAKLMGVTQVTLHKWRKKAPFLDERLEAYSQVESVVVDEQATFGEINADALSTDHIAHLKQQLRKVEQERDTLKKAIQILMRAD